MPNCEIVEQDEKWRDEQGRFVPGWPGGPGRPKGTPEQSTTEGRRIKAAILASWDEVDGPSILRQLAHEAPTEYLRLILRCLPRDVRDEFMNDDPERIGAEELVAHVPAETERAGAPHEPEMQEPDPPAYPPPGAIDDRAAPRAERQPCCVPEDDPLEDLLDDSEAA